jgi:hypothetical protein
MSADGSEPGVPTSGRFTVFNTGDTKAVLKQGHSEILICPSVLPNAPPFEEKPGTPLGDIELLPGDQTLIRFPSSAQECGPGTISDSDSRRHGYIYVIGWIEYVDATGRLHKKGFARQYFRDTRRFRGETDEDYEYDD